MFFSLANLVIISNSHIYPSLPPFSNASTNECCLNSKQSNFLLNIKLKRLSRDETVINKFYSSCPDCRIIRSYNPDMAKWSRSFAETDYQQERYRIRTRSFGVVQLLFPMKTFSNQKYLLSNQTQHKHKLGLTWE